jgi:hypothetical protein
MAPSGLLIASTRIINSFLRKYLWFLQDKNEAIIQASPIIMKLPILLLLILNILHNRFVTSEPESCVYGSFLPEIQKCMCFQHSCPANRENGCYTLYPGTNGIAALLSSEACTVPWCPWNFGMDYHDVLLFVNSETPICK